MQIAVQKTWSNCSILLHIFRREVKSTDCFVHPSNHPMANEAEKNKSKYCHFDVVYSFLLLLYLNRILISFLQFTFYWKIENKCYVNRDIKKKITKIEVFACSMVSPSTRRDKTSTFDMVDQLVKLKDRPYVGVTEAVRKWGERSRAFVFMYEWQKKTCIKKKPKDYKVIYVVQTWISQSTFTTIIAWIGKHSITHLFWMENLFIFLQIQIYE